MKIKHYLRKLNPHKDITHFQLPEKSLGYCLNYAIRKASHAYIARFDDDDFYSKFYLSTMIGALRKSKADIIGKRACLIYLESSAQLLFVIRKIKIKVLIKLPVPPFYAAKRFLRRFNLTMYPLEKQ